MKSCALNLQNPDCCYSFLPMSYIGKIRSINVTYLESFMDFNSRSSDTLKLDLEKQPTLAISSRAKLCKNMRKEMEVSKSQCQKYDNQNPVMQKKKKAVQQISVYFFLKLRTVSETFLKIKIRFLIVGLCMTSLNQVFYIGVRRNF